MYINESIKTQVVNEYDVAVCGGGFAGISAALSAVRQGSKVVLFEKSFMLGGLATAGLITIYLPLCDGFGKQVSFGIAEELFRLSIKHGAEADYPENWLDNVGVRDENSQRFMVRYNAQLFAILAEQLLIKEGVDIMYGTYVVGVDSNQDKISHLITENKSGRRAYKVKSVVDATGDCDVFAFAKVPTNTSSMGNFMSGWYYSLGENGYELRRLGAYKPPTRENLLKGKPTERTFSGVDGAEVSEFTTLSHRLSYEDFLKLREKDKTAVPVTISTFPQMRMTRKMVGEYTLSDIEEHKYFEDSIGMVSDWRKRGPVYEVPFRTLYSSSMKNLICAGRCVSVDEPMWDIMRVIPCCAVTGQAAGIAAAMTDDFTALDVKKLQQVLVENGVVLHENDLK